MRLLGARRIEMSKVKVRIAVAVDPSGDWNSSGWGGSSDDDKTGLAMD